MKILLTEGGRMTMGTTALYRSDCDEMRWDEGELETPLYVQFRRVMMLKLTNKTSTLSRFRRDVYQKDIWIRMERTSEFNGDQDCNHLIYIQMAMRWRKSRRTRTKKRKIGKFQWFQLFDINSYLNWDIVNTQPHAHKHSIQHAENHGILYFASAEWISKQIFLQHIFLPNTNFHELFGKARHINIYIRHQHTTQFSIISFCLEFSHHFPHFTGKNVEKNCLKKSQQIHSFQVRTNRIRRVGGKPRNTELILYDHAKSKCMNEWVFLLNLIFEINSEIRDDWCVLRADTGTRLNWTDKKIDFPYISRVDLKNFILFLFFLR